MTTQLYRHLDKHGALLYVGISLSTMQRLSQHKASPWFQDIASVHVTHYATKEEAAQAERRAIQQEKPAHNILHMPKPVTPREPWELTDIQRTHRNAITKAALADRKAQGVKLGGDNAGTRLRQQIATAYAEMLRPIVVELSHLSLRQMAVTMNERHIPTPSGRPWSATTVGRALGRLNYTASAMGRTPILTNEQRKAALKRRDAGEAHTDIARDFNVSHQTIGRLAHDATWQHSAWPLAPAIADIQVMARDESPLHQP